MGYAIHKDMMLAFAVSLALAAPSAAAASDDPPIHVWLNQDNYFVRGDRAKVYVRAAADGYLVVVRADADGRLRVLFPDRKSTRLNSSHGYISYAVFCLKKKKKSHM